MNEKTRDVLYQSCVDMFGAVSASHPHVISTLVALIQGSFVILVLHHHYSPSPHHHYIHHPLALGLLVITHVIPLMNICVMSSIERFPAMPRFVLITVFPL